MEIEVNVDKILVVINGKDRTKEIQLLNMEEDGKAIGVKFYNNKTVYTFTKDIVVKKYSEILDCTGKDIYYKNQILFNIEKIIRFEDLVKITYTNGEKQILKYRDINIKPINIYNLNKNVIEYFKEITKFLGNTDEDNYLKKEYEKINYINNESILNYYINQIDLKCDESEVDNIIYPFRFNLSQKEALENIFKSKISIIQGPPGTGKTQTILNIVANLAIMQNKTVAVVSNNNEAVKNVKEKLEKSGYGFIVADLGRKEKRENFFEHLPTANVKDFFREIDTEKTLNRIKELNRKLNELLIKNNRLAKLEKELEEYKLEQQYFEEYYKQQNIEKINKLSFYNDKDDDAIVQFILDAQMFYTGKIKSEWLYKIKLFFKYKVKNLKDLDENLMEYILNAQKEFYKIKIKKIQKEYWAIKNHLNANNFEELQKEHQKLSEVIFKNKLYEIYKDKKTDKFNFINYKQNINEFLKMFPILLSTTHSLRNCVPNDFMFDYVIIDEASQVDLLAGSLALSCAKNAIIVGDEKQLPQIVDKNIKEKISNNEIDICYDYFENNILSAILRTYKEAVPQQTLREHYRCHPKIIEFCNKRYYNNKLIAFSTKEHLKVKTPLILYYTSAGNHMRKITRGTEKGTFNERELEVIRDEVLKDNRINSYNNNEIGITTPYRKQANNIQKATEKDIQSDTIHKFQGREKKLIILSTVLDNSYMGKRGIEFVDDPCMINVAVSRAIEQFVVVTDKKLFNEEGNDIKALLKYIKYNELNSEIIDSQIVSVFDLLYKDHSHKLDELNNSLLYRSRFKSENIMDTILNKEFYKEEYKDYKYERGIFLRNLFLMLDNLTEEEKRYVNNGASIDFVIYDKMDNKPKLFIEVDGFEFHKNNPKQLEKDKLKDSIARKNGIDILRFETGGEAYDEKKIISKISNVLL